MSTASEMVHFYWYCATIAQLIEHMPGTTATRAVLLFAVRRATDTLTGKNGVPYASVEALKVCVTNGGTWEGCGLRKEHAIPVTCIRDEIVAALSTPYSAESLAEAKERLDEEMAAVIAKPGALDGFPGNPRIALVVKIIRASTALAWLTEKEDELLKARLADGSGSLIKRMPPDWDGKDPLARYRFCKIDVRPICCRR